MQYAVYCSGPYKDEVKVVRDIPRYLSQFMDVPQSKLEGCITDYFLLKEMLKSGEKLYNQAFYSERKEGVYKFLISSV